MQAAELANWAQVVTAIVTLVALVFAWVQVTSARWAQREATAKQIYAAYQHRAFEHPEFAMPTIINKQDRRNWLKYRWFVSSLLGAAEEILAMSDDPLWELTMKKNLAFHAEYLNSPEFLELEFELCDPKVKKLIKEITASRQPSVSPALV